MGAVLCVAGIGFVDRLGENGHGAQELDCREVSGQGLCSSEVTPTGFAEGTIQKRFCEVGDRHFAPVPSVGGPVSPRAVSPDVCLLPPSYVVTRLVWYLQPVEEHPAPNISANSLLGFAVDARRVKGELPQYMQDSVGIGRSKFVLFHIQFSAERITNPPRRERSSWRSPGTMG